jgi:hypothetical protein
MTSEPCSLLGRRHCKRSLAALAVTWALSALACGGEAGSPVDASIDVAVDAPSIEYRTYLMLERWLRTDPAARHTIAAPVTWNQDDPLPRYVDVDEHCGYHEGTWTGTAEPSLGIIQLQAPQLGEVTFTEDQPYEPTGGALGWDTGETLRVIAPGDELPGFDLSDTVPAPVALTSHDLEHATPGQIVVDRGAPLALTWQPTTEEVFVLFLQFDVSSQLRRGLLCFYPAGDGAATVPVAALEHLLPSTEVTKSNFYVSGASRQHRVLGPMKLEMVTWNGWSARVSVW